MSSCQHAQHPAGHATVYTVSCCWHQCILHAEHQCSAGRRSQHTSATPSCAVLRLAYCIAWFILCCLQDCSTVTTTLWEQCSTCHCCGDTAAKGCKPTCTLTCMRKLHGTYPHNGCVDGCQRLFICTAGCLPQGDAGCCCFLPTPCLLAGTDQALKQQLYEADG